ncbi:MAG: SGNH/GDSL hydrolase family protein [Patescibacteria group bacterium]|nr:SGNH/GDSL hydrolase family protein [Patescibacteria group bacterium]
MKRMLLILWTMVVVACPSAAEEPVLWDLAFHEIPPALQSGAIEKAHGKIILRDGAAFAVPAEAFPDPKNFTVKVTASLGELVENGVFTAMTKQSDQDDGFTFSMNYRAEPWYARQVTAMVNNILMTARAINGQRGPEIDTPYTFTVAVRNGYASFYIDDVLFKKCLMEMVPNHEPTWIGRNLGKHTKTMPVVIHEVKVYGPTHVYVSKKEPVSEHPRGAVAGKGWALDIPEIEHPQWPKILIYGDSISMGYRNYFIPDMLKHQAYVFHCCHFVGGDVPKQAITEMAARYKFDVVVFNNGLHSLHWTPDKVSDEVVRNRMRDLAQCIKAGAPQAKVYYLMTTPHTAPKPAPDQAVNELGDKNDVVVRLNALSSQVMEDEEIDVIDVYAVLAKQLELASGDGYHWHGPAYQIISEEIARRVLPVVGRE